MKKIKLLVVHPAADIGGAEICTRDLLRNLQIFEGVLLTQAGINSCFANTVEQTHYFDDYGCHAPYTLTPENIWKYACAVKTVTQLVKPDAILGMTHNGMVYVTLANDMNLARTTTFSVIAGHFSAYFNTIVKRSPNFSEKLLMRYCFGRTAGIMVPSRGVRDDLVMHFKANPDKVKAIHNGMNLDAIRHQASQSVEMQKDCAWIVTACRFSPPKDLETLLRAFRIVRDNRPAKLLLIGEGELRAQIESLIDDLELKDDVLLPGFMANPFPYVAKADIFVLSSLTEGFGNVIVEAMALGVPVVASDCPTGPAEIIEHGVNGYLVPLKDHQTMASQLLALLSDESLRSRIAVAGKERSHAFSIEKMTADYENYMLNAL